MEPKSICDCIGEKITSLTASIKAYQDVYDQRVLKRDPPSAILEAYSAVETVKKQLSEAKSDQLKNRCPTG